MRAQEFVTERKKSREDFEGMTIEMVENGHVLVINALDDWGNNVLGSVAFNIGDDNELDPQDLKVDERYQGQGIARAMYDYVKSKGYKIHRSYDQTDAGKGFWDKHRGEEQRVWENNAEVEEGKKRKNKKASRSLGGYFFPGYGYYGSGESGEGGGGGESGDGASGPFVACLLLARLLLAPAPASLTAFALRAARARASLLLLCLQLRLLLRLLLSLLLRLLVLVELLGRLLVLLV